MGWSDRWKWVAASAGCLILGACGEDGSPPLDAWMPNDGAPFVTDASPPAPAIPWLESGEPAVAPPALLPCPEGWREARQGSDPPHCEPYPEGGPATCGSGEAHFPGEAGCTTVGSPCPAGEFADDLPADAPVVFVRAGATGGDGSRATPFGSFASAVTASLGGGTIAVGKGDYDEHVWLYAPATLWGACAAETHMRVTEGRIASVIQVDRPGAGLRNLTIGDSPRSGIYMLGSGGVDRGELHIEGVIITGAAGSGITLIEQTQLTGDTVVIRDTVDRATAGMGGLGLQVFDGSTVDLRRAVLERNRYMAVGVGENGARALLSDVSLRETEVSATGQTGRGIHVTGDASVEVRRGLIEANVEVGVATDAGDVQLEDVVIRDTVGPAGGGAGGRGLNLQSGASVVARRALIEGNRDHGIAAFSEGTSLLLEDAIIRDTRSHPVHQRFGVGLRAQWSASVVARRVLLTRNRAAGVTVNGSGDAVPASVELEDVAIRDTEGRELEGLLGRGLVVELAGIVDARRLIIDGGRDMALFASNPGTVVRLQDVAMRALAGAATDGKLGRGMTVQFGARVEAARALIERARELGIAAIGTDTSLSLEDVVVRDTLPRACAFDTCAAEPGGTGVGSHDGAAVTMQRFVITRAALCGVQIASSAEIDLSTGEISENTIGACVQVDGYDLNRLSDDIRYRGNGANIQATTLPLPEATAGVDAGDPEEEAPVR